jgi:NADPH2:quinone reductase
VIALEVAAFGGPEVLRVVERAEPVPGPGEVLIRVEAVGVGWSDLLQREGVYPGGPPPPYVAGQEAAGVVVAHGPGVAGSPAGAMLPIGARVSAIARIGLCAEYAAVPAAACVAWPDELPAEQRAALPISLLTAYHALANCARAEAGELAVIHAAAGGLGSIAVQVAGLLGLGVIATCGPGKRAHVAGAERVCGYEELRGAAPGGVDVVLDSVGGAVFRASVGILRPLGRLLVAGASSGEPQRIDAIKLVHRSHAVIGVHLRHLLERPVLRERALDACVPWAVAGRVRARVEELPARELAAAHARLAARAEIGTLVVAF